MATVLTGAGLLAVVALCVYSIYKDKKAGRRSCGMNCAGCEYGGCAGCGGDSGGRGNDSGDY